MEISMHKGKNRSWTHWFEIPASNYDRAKRFYETIYQMDIETVEMGPYKMGIIPHNDVGCAIISGEGYDDAPPRGTQWTHRLYGCKSGSGYNFESH
mgnify:FL=1